MPRWDEVSKKRDQQVDDDNNEQSNNEENKSMSILDRMLSNHSSSSFNDGKDKESTMEDMYDLDDDEEEEDAGQRVRQQQKNQQQQQQQQLPPLSGEHLPNNNWIDKAQEMSVRLNDDPTHARPPVTHLQPNMNDDEDDDSVSQITSSITSHSYYNSLSQGSWGHSKKSKQQQQQQQQLPPHPQHEPSIGGETSLADTLDEIANMLGGGPASGGNAAVNATNSSINGRTQRRPYAVVNPLEKIYEAQNNNSEDFNHQRHQHQQQHHSYRKTPSLWDQYAKAASSPTGGQSNWMAYLNPLILLSHLFLQVKNFTASNDYYLRKKTDGDNNNHGGGGGRDDDYFDALMGSGSGGSVNQRASRRRYHKRKFRVVGMVVRFLILFCVMTAVLLVLRLGMMRNQFQNLSSRVSDSKAGHVLRNMMNGKPGRQRRRRGGGGRAGNERHPHGGMAHHTPTDDKLATTKKDTPLPNEREQDGAVEPEKVVVGRGSGRIHGGGGLKDMEGGSGEEVNIDAAVVRKGGYAHQDHIGLELPSVFQNFADVNDMPVLHGVDIPFFWHVPRSMGGTVNDILGGCLGLTIASDAGGQGSAANSNKLVVTRYPGHFSYVNVDTSTAEGIARARTLGLASSGLAGVVVSTLLHNSASLFTEDNQGRMFTIFRHPVERAVSLFHFVQDTQWRQRESFRKDLAELSIEEYFKSGLSENNWMTRVLINELTKGELTREDVNLAKEIMRRKCLIGLLKEKGETFARFERYFGWQLKSEEDKDCHEKKLQWAWPLKHRHDEVDEGSTMWDVIMAHNVYDLELYDYATVLFAEQSSLFQ